MSRQKDYKKNISYQIYLKLKEKILTLEYKPGEVLLEDDMVKEFDASRTPIREAIRYLKIEGFVNQGSGNKVSSLSLNEYVMIFQMRESLELLSIKLATLNWNEENIVLLENNLLKQKNLLYKKDHKHLFFLELDKEFHSIIAEIGGNFLLKQELLKYYDLYFRYNYFCGFKSRKDYAVVEHENLLTMIKTRNVNLSMSEMKSHMGNVNNNIIINLAKKLNQLNNEQDF